MSYNNIVIGGAWAECANFWFESLRNNLSSTSLSLTPLDWNIGADSKRVEAWRDWKGPYLLMWRDWKGIYWPTHGRSPIMRTVKDWGSQVCLSEFLHSREENTRLYHVHMSLCWGLFSVVLILTFTLMLAYCSLSTTYSELYVSAGLFGMPPPGLCKADSLLFRFQYFM